MENKNYKQRFLKGFNILAHSNKHPYTVWEHLMQLFAITIQNQSTLWFKEKEDLNKVWQDRENQYLKIINQYSKKEQGIITQMFALLTLEMSENPNQDLLGGLYMELGFGNKNAAQFFTPYSLCDLMSKITFDKKSVAKIVHTKGYVGVNDPTCGAGATLISAANECGELFKKLDYKNHVYFVGQDVDLAVCYMCYIQLSLIDVAGYVINADTLTQPKLELPKEINHVFFTPRYFSDVWTMRRIFHGLDILMRGNKNEKF